MRDSCGNSESKGDPTGASAPRADRPRKASALRSNQRPNLYKQKNVDKLDFHRVCLHSEQSANADCFLFFNNNESIVFHARPSHNRPIAVDFVSNDNLPLNYIRHMLGKTKMNGHS